MVIINFLPAEKCVAVEPGTTLLEAARKAGVEIEAPCGGAGTCGKCVVKVISGKVDSDSLGVLTRYSVSEGNVLACKTRVLPNETPVTVQLPVKKDRDGGQFSSSDDSLMIRQSLLPKNWQYDPLAVKWSVQVPEPQPGDGLSDLDRLILALQKEWGPKEFVCPLPIIQKVADTLRTQDGLVTATIIRQVDRYHLVNLEDGDHTTEDYGIAIDIGTTTVAVHLVFLPLAKIITTRVEYNDQITCGLDVISRINFAQKENGLAELRQRVLKTVNHLIQQAASDHDVALDAICDAVVSGNTIMIHLLLGLNPEYIRLEPYTPTVLEIPYLRASEIGFQINPLSWVYFSPNVGSYVGGDITAGLLCTDMAIPSEDINLFIDIGTNGEIVVGNSDFLMTCACSAGPAFEGGGIANGMRAAIGAIESVEIDPETGKASYSTIGNARPKGICGSGMISLLANLLTTGYMDAAGKLNRERGCEAITFEGRIGYYNIASAEESDTGEAIRINEKDIENIVRAKAAIYSACALLLDQVGLSFDDLAHIYIAGGFGRFLDHEKATILGLVPDQPREKFHYIGNSSLMGSYMVLVSQDYQLKQREIARKMTYIDLSTDPAYMDQYTGALFMPHTEMSHFPSVQAQLAPKKD